MEQQPGGGCRKPASKTCTSTTTSSTSSQQGDEHSQQGQDSRDSVQLLVLISVSENRRGLLHRSKDGRAAFTFTHQSIVMAVGKRKASNFTWDKICTTVSL